MSKNYLCKECKYNNNGWCTKRKIQGLKNITECYVVNENEAKEVDYMPYKTYAQREIFFHICSNIEVMTKDKDVVDVKELKSVMLSFDKILRVNEKLFGIETEYEVEKGIINRCNNLISKWVLDCKE